MTDHGFLLAVAAADLVEAGVLVGAWKSDAGTLAPVALASIPHLEGAFGGAGLDSRLLVEQQLFVALPGDHVDGRDFIEDALRAGHWVLAGTEDRGPTAADLSSMPAPEGTGLMLCTKGLDALQVLAKNHRQRWSGMMVGITGTNGKTTCKDLCAAMLGGQGEVCATQQNQNNRLGVPLTLLNLRPEHDFAVVEMGASAVGEIAALVALVDPQVGLITNAAAAHLAEFGSLAGIIEGKGELLAALPPGGKAILNADSPGYERWCQLATCEVISFGRETGQHRWRWRSQPGAGWITSVDGQDYTTPLPGSHNGANLTAALLAAKAAGLSEETARKGLEDFQGSPHRGQLWQWRDRLLLDDSYNANPRSMLASGTALVDLGHGKRTVAVLGAMGELGPNAEDLHRRTGQELAVAGVQLLLAVGNEAEALGLGFDEAGGEAHYCPTHTDAARWLTEHTGCGDVILLKGSRSSAMEQVMAHLPGITPVTQGS